MKNKIKSLCLSFVVALLCSCSVPTFLIVYNNTQNDLSILSDGKWYSIKDKNYKEIPFPHGKLKLDVISSTNTWQYKIGFPPRNFEKTKWEISPKIYLQIESNGWVYILYPTNDFPEINFPPQPKGYPLKPVN